MHTVSALASARLAFSVGSHSAVETNIKSGPKDVVEVPTDDDTAVKKTAVCATD